MIFEFNSSCFRDGNQTLSLLSMANIAFKGRHRLYVRDLEDPAYLDWIDALGADLVEQWSESLDLGVELEALEPAQVSVTVCEQSDPNYIPENLILGVSEAERLIREPFRVFVENDDADRDFLLTFSSEDQARKIRELENENLLSFEHCGGITELPKKVEKYATNSKTSFLNCSAIFDSDAAAPGIVSEQAQIAIDMCDSCAVFSRVLKRRAIENYLMRGWLETWVNSQPRPIKAAKINVYKSFCNLCPEQRSHFHMKKGLKADNTKIQSGQITLYADVSDADTTVLKEGFGDTLAADLYASEWVQCVQSVDDADAWGEVNSMVNELLVLCR